MKYLSQSKTTRQFVIIVGANYPSDTYNGGQVIVHKPANQHGVAIERPACALRGLDWSFAHLKPDEIMSFDYRACKKCRAKSPEYFSVRVAHYRWDNA